MHTTTHVTCTLVISWHTLEYVGKQLGDAAWRFCSVRVTCFLRTSNDLLTYTWLMSDVSKTNIDILDDLTKSFNVLKAYMKSYIQLEMAAIFFSSEPLSKTGYDLEVCHGWLHLHGLTRPVMNWELQNETFLLTVGFEPWIFRLRSERAKPWAIRADKYRAPKGGRTFTWVCYLKSPVPRDGCS